MIFTTPRSYESRRLRLRRQQLCTEEEADYEDLGDQDYNEVRAWLRRNILQTKEDLQQEDERDYEYDKVEVGIIASPRFYEHECISHRNIAGFHGDTSSYPHYLPGFSLHPSIVIYHLFITCCFVLIDPTVMFPY